MYSCLYLQSHGYSHGTWCSSVVTVSYFVPKWRIVGAPNGAATRRLALTATRRTMLAGWPAGRSSIGQRPTGHRIGQIGSSFESPYSRTCRKTHSHTHHPPYTRWQLGQHSKILSSVFFETRTGRFIEFSLARCSFRRCNCFMYTYTCSLLQFYQFQFFQPCGRNEEDVGQVL